MIKGQPTDLDPTIAPLVFDIDVLTIARVYATALLQTARKSDKVDLMQQHLDELFGTALERRPSHEYPQADDHGAIPRGRRKQVITEAFKGRVDDVFLDFLLVLNEHDRLDLIRPIAAEYRELRDKLYNRVRFQVRTAVKLNR